MQEFRRYCKTLKLKNDPQLIKEYKRIHASGEAWPEITQGMLGVGIRDMEIYIYNDTLFMIVDTIPEFDHEKAMQELANKPCQKECEAFVSRFQEAPFVSTAGKKWQPMKRIYKIERLA